MVVNKRKKFSRQRGRHTHGWGSKKKHRGSGNRGGVGMAGTGKRGDAIKTLIWKDKDYFGKHGFKFKGVQDKINAVNIDDIQCKLEKLIKDKLVLKEGNIYIIDLSKMGYNKLLGNGKVINKFKITVGYASSKAVEKIKNAGGEVILTEKEGEVNSSE
ncbi:MAG: 50S ribosomal protein L15 [Nanoarchaeota archaeon]|nr:50S ribosomal protein L15 [Nanoarchaeota archaeon]MBU1004338.1 50S ribosomal protein L15 [Nanoarchaeota archaeon]MBU1946311.1 50S ribosomal protein L15 [Nanoarchaeota archaeon]